MGFSARNAQVSPDPYRPDPQQARREAELAASSQKLEQVERAALQAVGQAGPDGGRPQVLQQHTTDDTGNGGRGHDKGPPGGGGGGHGGGNDGTPSEGRLDWNLWQERVRPSGGSQVVVRMTAGYEGYTLVVIHPDEGYGKVTGHKDGDLHRHGYMSDDAPKDDFVRSSRPFINLLGKLIGIRNPKR